MRSGPAGLRTCQGAPARPMPAVSDILGVPRYAVWVYLSELPSRAMAEYGHMQPEPGDEEAWLAALPDEDRRRFRSLEG